jgi:hypothetical protein
MTWITQLTERAQKEVAFCREYANNYSHDSDGRSRMRLVAQLAELLDARPPEFVIGQHDLLVALMLSLDTPTIELDTRVLAGRPDQYAIYDRGSIAGTTRKRYELVRIGRPA